MPCKTLVIYRVQRQPLGCHCYTLGPLTPGVPPGVRGPHTRQARGVPLISRWWNVASRAPGEAWPPASHPHDITHTLPSDAFISEVRNYSTNDKRNITRSYEVCDRYKSTDLRGSSTDSNMDEKNHNPKRNRLAATAALFTLRTITRMRYHLMGPFPGRPLPASPLSSAADPATGLTDILTPESTSLYKGVLKPVTRLQQT